MLDKYISIKYRFLLVICCFLSLGLSSQNADISAPYFVDSNDVPLPKICSAFEETPFTVLFENYDQSLNGTFLLELSDANGDFVDPIILDYITIVTGEEKYKSNFTISRNIRDEFVGGESFKLRIRLDGEQLFGEDSEEIPIHFFSDKKPRLDDKNGENGKFNIVLCSKSSTTLHLKDKTLAYVWYKGEDIITGESSGSLTVTTAGTYFARPLIEGSTCTLPESNRVTVTVVNGSSLKIGDVKELEICSGETHTFKASVQNDAYTYTWYKNGAIISGANTSTYTTTRDSSQFAKYKVRASGNSSGTCELLSPEIEIKPKKGSFSVDLKVPDKIFLNSNSLQADLKISYAGSATVQWFFKSSSSSSFTPIASATSDLYKAVQKGQYYAEVTSTASSSSCSPIVKSGKINVLSIDGISCILEFSDDYLPCKMNAAKIKVKNKIISGSKEYDMPASIESSVVYEWSKKYKGSDYKSLMGSNNNLDLSTSSDNGIYKVNAILGVQSSVSNELELRLLAEDFKIKSSIPLNSLAKGQSVELKVSPTVSGVMYKWTKDGLEISTDQKINANTFGKYKVLITSSGCENTLEVELKESSSDDIYVKDLQNILSPFNRDDVNDYWVLPKELLQENIRVIIYDTQGQELFNTVSYQNNWPSTDVEIGKQMILYYKIINKEKLIKAGTISIIK